MLVYYRILQQQFDEDDRKDVVVNAVYPCIKHSKIDQSNIQVLDAEEGGQFVFYMATVMPNSHGVFPRGSVIWNDSKVVDSQEKYNWNKKLQSRAEQDGSGQHADLGCGRGGWATDPSLLGV